MKEILCDQLDAKGIGHPAKRPVLAEPCRHERRKIQLPAKHRIKGQDLWRCVKCGDTIRVLVKPPPATPTLDRAIAEMAAAADPRSTPLRELLTALLAWNAAGPAGTSKRRTDQACEAVDRAQARIVMAGATA